MKIKKILLMSVLLGVFGTGGAGAEAAVDKSSTHFDAETKKLDPEFTERFNYFSTQEVPSLGKLDNRTRYMSILSALLGCQGVEEFKSVLNVALDDGLTPVEAKEIVYQATAYLGIGRIKPFLTATNEVMKAKKIKLPLESQSTTTLENRRELGTAKQVELFGEQMQDFWKNSDINYMLAANCFGDYYTCKGLSNKDRELITFCYIAAQGGCEPQLAAHIAANFKQGNDAKFLTNVVTEIQPYIGYPRSLNALAIIKQVSEKN
jgi:4-carboxymuconolactone decarboxylase